MGGFTCVVGGLPWYAHQRDLEGFIRFGVITSAKIMYDERNVPMGYGLVTFSSERGMRKAIEKMNGKPLPDTGPERHPLDVFEAKPGRDSWSWDMRECGRCGLPGHSKKDCNTIPPTDPKHVFAGELESDPFNPEPERMAAGEEKVLEDEGPCGSKATTGERFESLPYLTA
ncbi:glycine-rich RNA-binding protein RZ1A-like [Selaginella moellendorffii]|uniref:glycine-rich RNA-binding protein RZ1A-like n=1 Tax=Selaginella moellendorffii TaxID=88036 RepID=UPI000D1C7957|nr:glycine-rich RNA-binding protein RZ1A-like [Selaginella moellendorffii]|eukprot:XP_024535932.1 glycine-rich RNA-binding protein RZ1A-like [Selaginella moellendorffii]